jgi:hypothetical protein
LHKLQSRLSPSLTSLRRVFQPTTQNIPTNNNPRRNFTSNDLQRPPTTSNSMPPSTPTQTTAPTADDVRRWSASEIAQYLKPRLLESGLPEKYWPLFEALEIDGATFLDYCNMSFMAKHKLPLLLASRIYQHVRSFGGPFLAPLAAVRSKPKEEKRVLRLEGRFPSLCPSGSEAKQCYYW